MEKEKLIEFNGVIVVLTTANTIDEMQSFRDYAQVIISVYPAGLHGPYASVKVLRPEK